MSTQFVSAPDGARIAYDVTGSGPALMLLAGSNQTRLAWHTAGYVERLQHDWQVITVDVRGSGESEFLTEIGDYSITKICADLTTVAEACGARRFALLGYSLGGGLARFVATQTDRVIALVDVGSPLFGPAMDEESGQFVAQFLQKYGPLAQAYAAGQLTEEERASAVQRRIPVWVARFQAMADWPGVDPSDIRCPALVLIGTENRQVYRWAEANRQAFDGDQIQLEIIAGMDHEQEFNAIDRVYPLISAFLNSI